MQNYRQKPTYSIDAVDNALRLVEGLRDMGGIRLKDAAQELGVSPSTAHRLLAMLVYRGFAIQDESRTYLPGPAMLVGPSGSGSAKHLRAVTFPHLEFLSANVRESVNLMIRVGSYVRFLTTIESSSALRVGDRQGMVMPARVTAGGKAMLAELSSKTLEQLYLTRNAEAGGERIVDREYPRFLRQLQAVRHQGFALNQDESEEGVSAVGASLHDADGRVLGAISVSVPTVRFQRRRDEGLAEAVLQSRDDIERELLSTF